MLRPVATCLQEGLGPELSNTQTLHLPAGKQAAIPSGEDLLLPSASQSQQPVAVQSPAPDPEVAEPQQPLLPDYERQGDFSGASDPLSAGLIEREQTQKSLLD